MMRISRKLHSCPTGTRCLVVRVLERSMSVLSDFFVSTFISRLVAFHVFVVTTPFAYVIEVTRESQSYTYIVAGCLLRGPVGPESHSQKAATVVSPHTRFSAQ